MKENILKMTLQKRQLKQSTKTIPSSGLMADFSKPVIQGSLQQIPDGDE
jgi:hypothetical protein